MSYKFQTIPTIFKLNKELQNVQLVEYFYSLSSLRIVIVVNCNNHSMVMIYHFLQILYV